MRVLAISGSLRGGSYNTSLLNALATAMPDGHDWQVLDPKLVKHLPPYDQDDEQQHIATNLPLRAIMAELHAADVVVISTPEYNGSIPGQLKNMLDWASRPFDGNPLRSKPVAVLSASDGQFGGVWANNELRKVVGTLGGRVIERQVALPLAHMQFDDAGALRNAGTQGQVDALARDIAASIPYVLEVRPVSG